jgi:KipI family sensor histidine kinase inhibitor
VPDPSTPSVRIDPFGDRALLVRAGTQGEILGLTAALLDGLAAGTLVDLVPGDRSLLVVVDGTDRGEAAARAAVAAASRTQAPPPAPRRHVIPVRYGGDDGPDLVDVATLTGSTADDVIARHTAREYPVLFLGFAPGFPYLGDLPPELRVPRLDIPRTTTPAGSVALAESYTGIYPADLPGGWRIIGRTSAAMFDPTADPPAMLLPGDLVRFEPA